MTADLSGATSGQSERFVPDQDRGRLIEAERLARYRWAAQVAAGRTVLDAGCGTADGSRLLAQAGATEVVGVDIAESVLKAVAPSMPESVRLQPGDLCALDHEDDRFELIVCFEVLEHVEHPEAMLDELVRVLAPDGVLLVSSPNRGVHPGDNPHHRRELTSAELEQMLRARLAQVRLMRQHDYIVSAVLTDDAYGRDGPGAVSGMSLDKLVAGDPGAELFTIAIAGDGSLTEPPELGAMTGPLELAGWIEAAERQDEAIRSRDDQLAELRARLGERDQLSAQLTDAEQRAASIPALRERIEGLERELTTVNELLDDSRAQARQLDERLMSSERVLREVFRSPSWQVTKPLRYAKRRLTQR